MASRLSGVLNLGLSCCVSMLLWAGGAGLGGDTTIARALHQEIDESAWDAPPTALDLPPLPAAADRDALATRIEDIVRRSGVPGAAVAVVDGSGAWVRGFGMAALGGEGRPMTPQTLFRVGSLTKSFVTLAILRLVEAGRLRLEDPVRKLAPELQIENRWERTDPVRVAHLLEHTSGFDEMRFNEIFDDDARQDRPLREVLARNPNSRKVRWKPGSAWAYSQPGYTVAAYIIEKVSGMPYERFLQEQVFAPLGIEGAALRLEPEVRTRLAVGHHRRGPLNQIMLLHRPAGNLMISAAGVARLIQMQLGRGLIDGRRFLQASSIDRMEHCGTMPSAPVTACYGMGNWGDVVGPLPMRGHGGFMPGYFTNYRYSPARGWGYVVMTNDTGLGRVLRDITMAILFHLLAADPPPRPPSVPWPHDLQRYAGHYRFAAPEVEFLRFRSDVYAGLDVEIGDGRLYMRADEFGTLALVPTGDDLFRTKRECDTSVRFSVSPEGRRLMVWHSAVFEEESAAWAAARRALLELALLLLRSTIVIPLLILLALDRAGARRLLLRPLVAAACLLGMASAFDYAQNEALLGVACLPTVAIWILSWVFALAAHLGLRSAVRSMRAGTAPALLRTYAVLVSGAAVWVALHLSRYGLIGLRTWRW